MTIATRELRASYAFIERNFNLTKRYWGWEVAWLLYSIAGALAVSFIGVDQGNGLLLQTLVIGTIFWNFLSIVFGFIGETVTWEGTLEYTFMAPVRRYTQLIGSTFFAGLRARADADHPGRDDPVLRPGVHRRQLRDRRRLHPARLGELRRCRDDGRHPAAPLRR